jgi:hypothetical protein
MIQQIPTFVTALFALTTLATFVLLMQAIQKSTLLLSTKTLGFIALALLAWLGVQLVLAKNLVYANSVNVLPPKMLLFGLLPTVIALIALFNTAKGKRFIDSLPLKNLTALSIVRIPVEIGLYYLAVHKAIPFLMTLEGNNLDIVSGITAPLIAYFGFVKNTLNKKIIIAWNVLCLTLVVNVVCIGIFSLPTPLQQLAFDQPNIAILYFPFVWLPTFIVPVVLFCHLVSLRRLLGKG